MSDRHPQHDAIAAEVRSWYHQSYPEMGYLAEEREFGWYRRMLRRNDVQLKRIGPTDLPPLLLDVRDYFGDADVRIVIDDRQADRTLTGPLAAAGWQPVRSDVFHAYVGAPPRAPDVDGLTVEPVSAGTAALYSEIRIRAFANSEVQPTAEDVEAEARQRRAEMTSEGRFFIARASGEAAAIIGWYEGADRFVFQLGTRLPFRRRGIARKLLCDLLADSNDHGCRSVVINANEADWPVTYYRRLGFRDEVYWHREYGIKATPESSG